MSMSRSTAGCRAPHVACLALLLTMAMPACRSAQPTGAAVGPAAAGVADRRSGTETYPHAADSIGALREIYDGVLSPDVAVRTFRNIDRLLPVRTVPASDHARPLARADRTLPSLDIRDAGRSYTLDEFLDGQPRGRPARAARRARGGRAYRYGNTPRTRWMSMSVAKSLTSTLVGAALRDGHITSLDDPVVRYVPALAGSAYDGRVGAPRAHDGVGGVVARDVHRSHLRPSPAARCTALAHARIADGR